MQRFTFENHLTFENHSKTIRTQFENNSFSILFGELCSYANEITIYMTSQKNGGQIVYRNLPFILHLYYIIQKWKQNCDLIVTVNIHQLFRILISQMLCNVTRYSRSSHCWFLFATDSGAVSPNVWQRIFFKELQRILQNSDNVTIFISATFFLKHQLA
jgi:hypothetical protein